MRPPRLMTNCAVSTTMRNSADQTWEREVKCCVTNGTKYCVHTYNETWSSKKTDSRFRATLALTLIVAACDVIPPD